MMADRIGEAFMTTTGHLPTRRRWGLSVRDQIVAVVAAVVVPGLLLGGWLVFQSAQAQAEQIELQAANDAHEIATLIDRELVSSMNMLTALASSYSLQSGDMDSFHAELVHVARQLDIRIALRDAKQDRQILNSETRADSPTLTGMPSTRGQLEREVLRTGQVGISKVFSSVIWKQFVVAVVMPIRRDGEIAYTMTLAIPTVRFVPILAIAAQYTVTIVDRDGNVVARSPDHERFVGAAAPFGLPAMVSSNSAPRLRLKQRDVKFYQTQAKTQVTDWTIDVSVPRKVLDGPVRQAVAVYAAAGGSLIFAALALAFFVGGHIERSVGSLGIDREPTREELAEMFENAPNGVLIIDASGTIMLASGLLESMFGYGRRELIGQSVAKLFSERLNLALARPLSETKDDRSLVGHRKDGSEFPVEIGYNSLRIGTSRLIRLAVVDISQRKLTEERLAQAVAERDQMRRRLMQAQDDERRRLARDLHDQTGQALTAAMLDLKAMEPQVAESDRFRMRNIQIQFEKIGETLHRVVWELRPAAIDHLGLAAVLASYVEEWNAQYGIRADFHCRDSMVDMLPADVRTTLYRLVQEGLTNIAKHARAAMSVSVVIDRLGATSRLTIEDDGPGFDPSAQRPGSREGGLGIAGMRERIALLGGTLEIETSVGRGTTVYARIPIEAERLIA
jgi:two-component system sensor histidine kinase UhpB